MSGHHIRSNSDVHPGTVFKLQDRAVGTALVRMFSNFQQWDIEVDTYRMHISDVYFNDLRSSQFSTLSNITLGVNFSSVHNFETKVIDELNGQSIWHQSIQRVCLVAPNRMIPNMTNVDLTWLVSVTPNWVEVALRESLLWIPPIKRFGQKFL